MSNADYSTVATNASFNPVASLRTGVDEHANDLNIVALREVEGVTFGIGSAVLIDDEVITISNIATGVWTVKRGCADTIPQKHSASAPMFVLTSVGTDKREYLGTATVAVKLLPKTPSGTTPVAYSPPTDITFAQRFARPYPPAQVKVGTQPWTTETLLADGTSVNLSWVTRNRVTQADVLLGHQDGAVAPEAGTDYVLDVVRADNTVARSYAVSTTSFAYTLSNAISDMGLSQGVGFYNGKLKLSSRRDGLKSRHAYDVPVKIDLANLSVKKRVFVWYDPSNNTMTLAGSVNDYMPSSVAGNSRKQGSFLITRQVQAPDGCSAVGLAMSDDAGVYAGPFGFAAGASGTLTAFNFPFSSYNWPTITSSMASAHDPATNDVLVMHVLRDQFGTPTGQKEFRVGPTGSVSTPTDASLSGAALTYDIAKMIKFGTKFYGFTRDFSNVAKAFVRATTGTWSEITNWFNYSDLPSSWSKNVLGAFEFSGVLFVAISATTSNGDDYIYILKSSDGTTWTHVTPPPNPALAFPASLGGAVVWNLGGTAATASYFMVSGLTKIGSTGAAIYFVRSGSNSKLFRLYIPDTAASSYSFQECTYPANVTGADGLIGSNDGACVLVRGWKTEGFDPFPTLLKSTDGLTFTEVTGTGLQVANHSAIRSDDPLKPQAVRGNKILVERVMLALS
jgi:hypothetical protein